MQKVRAHYSSVQRNPTYSSGLPVLPLPLYQRSLAHDRLHSKRPQIDWQLLPRPIKILVEMPCLSYNTSFFKPLVTYIYANTSNNSSVIPKVSSLVIDI